ncbi:MAG: phytoene desaturase [Flavobacteriales bacterium]|nr:phytoene desaturase [Flavobacteriales bacterium]MCB9171044.1 phytoene desaturase [Flavobacteriales bacterium]
MMSRAIVIGSGFAGTAAATSLARQGHAVTVFEKNAQSGGRARVWRKDGFTFDMGPSFYWMPEVFTRYFARFDRKVEDLYKLVRLDPSYKVVFGRNEQWNIPAGRAGVSALFERIEPGSGAALDRFLDEARVKYTLGMGELVYRPSLSWSEYMHPGVLGGLLRTHVLGSLRSHVQAHFHDPRLRLLMEFPVLFLGAAPQHTPALYSLMNHADIDLGTWYPLGGMGRVVEAMVRVAQEEGVVIHCKDPVSAILTDRGRTTGVCTSSGEHYADVVVAAADYHHVEQNLLPEGARSYSTDYWSRRVMAPAALLYYLGIDRTVPGLEHHTLFFDAPLDDHSTDIYERPNWPRRPLFYVSAASKTDPSTAPEGMENLVVLIPVAAGLSDTPDVRDHYLGVVLERMKEQLGIDLRPHLCVQRSYCINEMTTDLNAYRGNAYGLANTLRQTGPLRPRLKSRKVKGLYFAGQLTVPGPGVPPALISGQVVADLITKEMQTA